MAKRTLNKLTTYTIQKLIREVESTGQSKTKADGGGLTLTISTSGYRAWVIRYRHNGEGREFTRLPTRWRMITV